MPFDLGVKQPAIEFSRLRACPGVEFDFRLGPPVDRGLRAKAISALH